MALFDSRWQRLDHDRNMIRVAGIVAGSGTPTWATILVAVLTGLFGFASGAGAAAVVSTSHERAERFRSRMIEAADAFVGALVKTDQLIRAAWINTLYAIQLAEGGTETYLVRETVEALKRRLGPSLDGQEVVEAERHARGSVDAASESIDEMEHLLPRLFIVFKDEDVGSQSTSLCAAMRDRLFWMQVRLDGQREQDWYVKEDENKRTYNRLKTATLQTFNKSIRKRVLL